MPKHETQNTFCWVISEVNNEIVFLKMYFLIYAQAFDDIMKIEYLKL